MRGEISECVRRSQSQAFDITANCLNCGRELIADLKHPGRNIIHGAQTLKPMHSVRQKCGQRNADWGVTVQLRIENSGDLVAAEYHHDCQVRFHAHKVLDGAKGRPSGCYDGKKQAAFEKLYEYLDQNDEYQYSLGDLFTRMDEFLDGSEGCTQKLSNKNYVQDHYGNDMIVTNKQGKETLYIFLDMGHRILRVTYHEMGLRKENIADTAATLIEHEIHLMVFDTSKYQKFAEMAESDLVPSLLLRLLSRIISSKSKVQNTAEP